MKISIQHISNDEIARDFRTSQTDLWVARELLESLGFLSDSVKVLCLEYETRVVFNKNTGYVLVVFENSDQIEYNVLMKVAFTLQS